jgi:hypothetical protein
MRPKGSPEELARRRRRALELLDRGLWPGDVAERVEVVRRSVRRRRRRTATGRGLDISWDGTGQPA